MVLTIILSLLFLVVLVLAFVGVFGRFPDNWEWVGIVLAGVGIAMGAPSLLQMIVGKPKLEVEFFRIVEGRERALAVFLKNSPVESKLWRKLGVKRDIIESLTVSFRLSEGGTGKVIIPVRQARLYSDAVDDSGLWRTTLPPTLSLETSIMIARWDEDSRKGVVPPDRTKPAKELGEGIYYVQVIVAVDGHPLRYPRQFIVGKSADDLMWVEPAKRKKSSRQTD